MYRGYRFNTAHDTGDTIIAQYELYPGVLPMYSGVVVDGKLDPMDITAGILHLAQEGFYEKAFKFKKNYIIASFTFVTLLIYLSFKYGGELVAVLVFCIVGVGRNNININGESKEDCTRLQSKASYQRI